MSGTFSLVLWRLCSECHFSLTLFKEYSFLGEVLTGLRTSFLCSYNRIGREADEADIEEIIDMASKASLADQQQLVQENVHSQIKTFCSLMDEIVLSGKETANPLQSPSADSAPRRSGLSLAVGGTSGSTQTHSG